MPDVVYYDMNNFARRLFEDGSSVKGAYNALAFDPNIVVAVWDGAGSLARRREIFPGYKVKKESEQPGENIWASFKLLKELLKMSKVIQVECHGWEADDVLATLILKRGEPARIHTTDQDYLQLPNVTTDRKPEQIKVEPRWLRLYKACVGDPADKIPGIKGFGEKAWQACDKELLEEFVACGNMHVDLDAAGLTKAQREWASEHHERIMSFYEIVGFITVPDDELEAGTIIGRPNPQAVAAIFQKYLM